MPAGVTGHEAAPQPLWFGQKRPGNAPRKPVITVMGTLGSSSAMAVGGVMDLHRSVLLWLFRSLQPDTATPTKTDSLKRNTAA